MPKPNAMLRSNTPIEDYRKEYGLLVKREDLACPLPGPPFSKTRGVYTHLLKRKETIIGVLDTAHSQAGWAVARACQILGKQCINFYPVYKRELDDNDPPQHELRTPQIRARELGATMYPLTAGRSCILYHAARKITEGQYDGYLMPNALKLPESVTETAKEVPDYTEGIDAVLLPTSSGTIAAGVIRGFAERTEIATDLPTFIIHLGYSRSHDEVRKYLYEQSDVADDAIFHIVDEHYSYKDAARPGPTPPWPCNNYYDLKAFRWWMSTGRKEYKQALLWNIG